MGGAWGELNMLLKNTCERVHLIVKLPAIRLQVSKFTKNDLLHTYFSRILARFYIIIYCAFSENHFMEGCFMFQWGIVFQKEGFIFKWRGAPHRGALVLIRGVEKNGKMGGTPCPLPPIWETLMSERIFYCFASSMGAKNTQNYLNRSEEEETCLRASLSPAL